MAPSYPWTGDAPRWVAIPKKREVGTLLATKCATHGGTRLSRWRGSGVRISLLVVRSAGVWVGLALGRRGRSKRDERTLLLRKFSTVSTRRPPAKRGRAVVSNRAEEPSILVSSAATRRSSLPVRASRRPRGDRCSSRRRSGYRSLGSSGPNLLGSSRLTTTGSLPTQSSPTPSDRSCNDVVVRPDATSARQEEAISMFDALQILTLLLVVLAMTPALAHALELPGKLRLPKDTYIAMQPIYYPGFTIAGICEPIAIISTAVLLFATRSGTADFWLTLVALLGLAGMHAAYWILTHPVNRFWLEDERLSGLGAGFFSFASAGTRQDEPRPVSWTDLRDRWEYSHVVRAGLSAVSLVALAVAVA